MTYYRQIYLSTPWGTEGLVFIASENARFIELASESIRRLTDEFDVIEKADAVREAEGIVYEELWREVVKSLL